MTIGRIILGIMTVVAVICGIIGGLIILGAVGEATVNPNASIAWMLRMVGKGALFFIPAVIACFVEDEIE